MSCLQHYHLAKLRENQSEILPRNWFAMSSPLVIGSKLQGTTYKAVRDELWIMAAGHKGKQGFHGREIVESDHSTCTQGSPRNGTNKISTKSERVVARS